MKRIGSGTAWVSRWFAKPPITGSIPATASIFRPLYGQRWMGAGHRFQLGQAFAERLARLGGGPFRSGMSQWVHTERYHGKPKSLTCPADRLKEFHQMAVDAMTEASNLREKNAALGKELSALKRANGIGG